MYRKAAAPFLAADYVDQSHVWRRTKYILYRQISDIGKEWIFAWILPEIKRRKIHPVPSSDEIELPQQFVTHIILYVKPRHPI